MLTCRTCRRKLDPSLFSLDVDHLHDPENKLKKMPGYVYNNCGQCIAKVLGKSLCLDCYELYPEGSHWMENDKDLCKTCNRQGEVSLMSERTHKKKAVEAPCGFCKKAGAIARCSGCYTENYCNGDCQRKDWDNHKKDCGEQKKIRALRRKKRKCGVCGQDQMGHLFEEGTDTCDWCVRKAERKAETERRQELDPMLRSKRFSVGPRVMGVENDFSGTVVEIDYTWGHRKKVPGCAIQWDESGMDDWMPLADLDNKKMFRILET
jgi:hypothetical protein